MDNYLNQVISDRYEIKEIIGVGGMALVYKAYDRVDDRIVAVKILKDEYLANAEYRIRFKNESKAISVLNHPNIVKVYDVCFSDTLQYIVMEHVEGITLKEFIKRQHCLDWKEALLFSVQILKALQHAHDKGVIHRDIKPQNILLLPNASIKVTDFGIAGFKRGEIHSVDGNDAIGSVHYVSPEQARGEYTDEKSDIYSVGVVLYEMLTGRIPFDSEKDENVAWMQLESVAVRPTKINPSIPMGLEQITLRAMQKNPNERYRSAAEFLMDLDEFRKNPDILFDYDYFIDSNPTKFIGNNGASPVPPLNMLRNEPIPDSDFYDDEDDEDDDDDEEYSRSPIVPILIGVAITLILGIVIIGLIFVLPGLTGNDSEGGSKFNLFSCHSGDEVEVPNFYNMKYEEVLEKYPDYAFAEPQYEYNSAIEDGCVSKQHPEAGEKISKDTVIKLTVATTREMVLVIDVSGCKTSEAEEKLKNSGFVIEFIPVIDDTKEDGEVLYSVPAANSYAPYMSTVNVYYAMSSSSIGSVRVPRVIGYELEAAKAKIINAGLTVGAVTEGASSPALKGYVISQTPEATVAVNEGVNVNLVIGNGIPATNTAIFSISLPGIGAGTTSTIATYLNDTPYDTIPGVDLGVGTYQLSFTGSGDENSFKIYCDDVLVYTGDIDFTTTPPTISNVHGYQFSTKVSVPNVVGKTESAAEAELSAAGFNRVKVVTEPSNTVEAGVVISQTPIYSETAKYSTATIITIVVSEGPSDVPEESTGTGTSDPVTDPSVETEPTTAPPVSTPPIKPEDPEE